MTSRGNFIRFNILILAYDYQKSTLLSLTRFFFIKKSNDKILESIYEANYIYIFDIIYKINCIF